MPNSDFGGGATRLFWEPQSPERPNYPQKPAVHEFREFVNKRYKLSLRNHWELHNWTVENIGEFWKSAWDHTGIIGEKGDDKAGFYEGHCVLSTETETLLMLSSGASFV
jgi:hypothetical protein